MTRVSPAVAPPPTLDFNRRSRWAIVAVAAAALALRVWYAWFRPLLPDEAYYWSWTRHLSGGYFDHPPLIAYLVFVSTRLFGTGELGVRAAGVLLMAATVALLLATARRVGVGAPGRILLLAIWLTSPLLAGLATMMTPDTPAAFFATAALALAVGISRGLEASDVPRWDVRWVALGAAGGLALLSKYTAVLTGGAIALALLTDPKGRRALAGPGPWLAAALALAVFSPTLVWNARHGWASLSFQFHHGLSERETNPGLGLLRFLGGQIGVWTPVLFFLGALATFDCWRRYLTLPLADRILTWAATLPLALFAYAATRTHGEENWPDLAYFPMSILTVKWVARAWDRRAQAAWVGCAVALAVFAVMHCPEAIRGAGLRVPVGLRNLFGWRELGAEIGRVRDRVRPDLILADRGQDAAELMYYISGRPMVWNYRPPGTKPFAYDFFEDRPDFHRARRVLFVGNHADDFCREYGFSPVSSGLWVYKHGGRTPDRTRSYWVLEPSAHASSS